MFSFKTMKSHNALHITHRTIATVSLKERLLHKIPKQIQAVTQSGKRNSNIISKIMLKETSKFVF